MFLSIKPVKSSETLRAGDPRIDVRKSASENYSFYNPLKWFNNKQEKKNSERFGAYRYSEIDAESSELEPIDETVNCERNFWHLPSLGYKDDPEKEDLELELDSYKQSMEDISAKLFRIKSQMTTALDSLKRGRCVIPDPKEDADLEAFRMDETRHVKAKVKDVIRDLQGLANEMEDYADRTGQRSVSPRKKTSAAWGDFL